MRIVLDFQAAQESCYRGIGRWSISFTRALIAEAGADAEFWILLGANFPEALDHCRAELSDLVPAERFLYFTPVLPVDGRDPQYTDNRAYSAEIWRALVASVEPDIVCATGAFSSINILQPVPDPRWRLAAVLYDLIPLVFKNTFLQAAASRLLYSHGLKCLRQADLLLAISESAREEAILHLGKNPASITTISSASTDFFRPVEGRAEIAQIPSLRQLGPRFLLTVGAESPHKNLPALIQAFAGLPHELRRQLQLVIVCAKPTPPFQKLIKEQIETSGLRGTDVIFATGVNDHALRELYTQCELFVFASLYEGFGLPVLEAMQCGAPVIASRTSSLPEVIGLPEAMFEPSQVSSITQAIHKALTDKEFRQQLLHNSSVQPQKFSWKLTAERAFTRLQALADSPRVLTQAFESLPGGKRPVALVILARTPLSPPTAASAQLRSCLNQDHVVTEYRVASGYYSDTEDHEGTLKPIQELDEVLNRYPSVHVLLEHDPDLEICQLVARKYVTLVCAVSMSSTVAALISGMSQKGLNRYQRICWQESGVSGLLESLNVENFDPARPLAEFLRTSAADVRTLTDFLSADAFPESKDQPSPENPGPSTARRYLREVTRDISLLTPPGDDEPILKLRRYLAQSIAATSASRFAAPRIWCDMTELARSDSGTGIQRVTREISSHLAVSPWPGFHTEFCGMTPENEIEAQLRYVAKKHGLPSSLWPNQIAHLSQHDLYLGIDLNSARDIVAFWKKNLAHIAHSCTVVYDLLPISQPQHFCEGVVSAHHRWIEAISMCMDSVICISRTVAEELHAYLSASNFSRVRSAPLKIGFFHLGSDFRLSTTPDDTPTESAASKGRNFLMVSTVESRKGYAQALDAFEILWAEGEDVTLTIVGRRGWKVEKLIRKIQTHPLKGKRLFWHEGASDEQLAAEYARADCVIVASVGEGFGLSLVEAARFGKPILSRDLPVFREVAGEHAAYFSGSAPESLAKAIQTWVKDDLVGNAPSTQNMKIITWEESVGQIRKVLLDGHWLCEWTPRSAASRIHSS